MSFRPRIMYGVNSGRATEGRRSERSERAHPVFLRVSGCRIKSGMTDQQTLWTDAELISRIICSELITPNYELWFLRQGEVAEWLKAPLSKSGSPERRRGFESHPLRHAPRGVHGNPELHVVQGASVKYSIIWIEG